MSDISRGSLSESPAKLDDETEQLLQWLFVNADHIGTRDVINRLRSRIRELVEDARQEGVRAVQLDKARGIWPPIREGDQTIGSHLNFDRTDD